MKKTVGRVVFLIILAVVIRQYFLQAFFVPASSMSPTLNKGDRFLVAKWIYPLKSPSRGDIIVFWFEEESKHFVKRIVGCPGDRIEIVRKQLRVNNIEQQEPYVEHNDPDYDPARDDLKPLVVPKDRFFVMGDNRDYSKDSRFWGYVQKKDILGKVFFVYWPKDHIGTPK